MTKSNMISSVNNLSVAVENGEVVLEQDGFDRNVEFTCNRISVTAQQVAQLVESLLEAAAEIGESDFMEFPCGCFADLKLRREKKAERAAHAHS
ncbi:hypothetical protein [Acidobacterium sp. S8]|uniref:hypothetical protein n=1 Tax=Acidobacterium sp. S8 TaxID=1641854 RepID=UPI00131B1C82|nr:hypothetical protein [Acidobacterium sp. S8]